MSDFPQTPETNELVEPVEVIEAPETNDIAVADATEKGSAFAAPPAPATTRANQRSPWVGRIATVVAAALVGGLAGHFSAPRTTSALTIAENNAQPGAAAMAGGLSIPALVSRVDKTIVGIDVKGSGSEDQGTGMIITHDGLVLTNNHVIAAAAQGGTITVTRVGTTKALSATLVGTNPANDVALLRIDNAHDLPAVTFGNSNALLVGDSVVAIGNALGLALGTPTVTSGIVSALGRTVTASSSSASETLNGMIQTDAAINPGNSGGPLLDAQGDVIGMNTAVAGTLADGTSAQNIGFAIPVATIKSLLPKLKAGQSVVTHGAFIGVEISTLTAALQAEYGYTESAGVLVMSVIAGTGAASAGVKQGDLITAIDGQNVASDQDVSSVVSALRPGDVIHVTIMRGTKKLHLAITLGHVPNGF